MICFFNHKNISPYQSLCTYNSLLLSFFFYTLFIDFVHLFNTCSTSRKLVAGLATCITSTHHFDSWSISDIGFVSTTQVAACHLLPVKKMARDHSTAVNVVMGQGLHATSQTRSQIGIVIVWSWISNKIRGGKENLLKKKSSYWKWSRVGLCLLGYLLNFAWSSMRLNHVCL